MTDQIAAVVIDNGEYECKGGFASGETPKVGYHVRTIGSKSSNSVYPIDRGIITNWSDMEDIWHKIFRFGLRVDPAEHPVLLVNNLMTPNADKERMIQIMFEKFNVPSYCATSQQLCSLYANAQTTGIVVDLGEGLSRFTPIYEGKVILNASIQNNLGGRDIDSFLLMMLEAEQFLGESGGYASLSRKKEIVGDTKEEYCYVALDFDAELQKAHTSKECDVLCTFPGDNSITIANERFRAPELLFKPHLNGLNSDGIHQTLFESINKCDINIHRDFYPNIVLSGGSSMFKGLPERIEKEIASIAPPTMKIKIIAPPERKHAAWIGGSIIASLATFSNISVKRQEYDEVGSQIVHTKFKEV